MSTKSKVQLRLVLNAICFTDTTQRHSSSGRHIVLQSPWQKDPLADSGQSADWQILLLPVLLTGLKSRLCTHGAVNERANLQPLDLYWSLHYVNGQFTTAMKNVYVTLKSTVNQVSVNCFTEHRNTLEIALHLLIHSTLRNPYMIYVIKLMLIIPLSYGDWMFVGSETLISCQGRLASPAAWLKVKSLYNLYLRKYTLCCKLSRKWCRWRKPIDK